MKKFLSAAIAFAVMLSLTACGSQNDISATTAEETWNSSGAAAADTTVSLANDVPDGEMSEAQKKAVAAAKDYLEATPFSRNGLIEQLKFDGFTHETAEFAVAQFEVDWKANAVQAARDQLAEDCDSRAGLLEMMNYFLFTEEEAIYAVDHCDADWKANALQAAKNIHENLSASHDELVGLLEFARYTEEEIQYAMEETGY